MCAKSYPVKHIFTCVFIVLFFISVFSVALLPKVFVLSSLLRTHHTEGLSTPLSHIKLFVFEKTWLKYEYKYKEENLIDNIKVRLDYCIIIFNECRFFPVLLNFSVKNSLNFKYSYYQS